MKMREIGGYFEFETLKGSEFHSELLKFNSSRNCLRFLIRAKKIKKIYLPVFLCDVVYEACLKENVKVVFYHIDRSFLPILDYVDDYVYVVNYYGLISNSDLVMLKNKYKSIIVDNTHSFFQLPIKCVDTIYNCRKYFGVPDGAYLSTDLVMNEILKPQSVKNIISHLFGRMENNAGSYYDEFCKNDSKFNLMDIRKMSKFTTSIMKVIDYDEVLSKRKDNYRCLHNGLVKIQRLDIKTDTTFMYPLMLDSKLFGLRDYLIENKVYVPCLWNNIPSTEELNDFEKQIQKMILLPIDQRYNVDDMLYILDLIFKYVEAVESEKN